MQYIYLLDFSFALFKPGVGKKGCTVGGGQNIAFRKLHEFHFRGFVIFHSFILLDYLTVLTVGYLALYFAASVE